VRHRVASTQERVLCCRSCATCWILTIIATTSEAQISVPAMSLPRDATIEMRPVVSVRLPADAVSHDHAA
jgi:hypothetical protein